MIPQRLSFYLRSLPSKDSILCKALSFSNHLFRFSLIILLVFSLQQVIYTSISHPLTLGSQAVLIVPLLPCQLVSTDLSRFLFLSRLHSFAVQPFHLYVSAILSPSVVRFH